MAHGNPSRLEGCQGNEVVRPHDWNERHRRRFVSFGTPRMPEIPRAGNDWQRTRKWPLPFATHLILGLVNEQTAAEILDFCEGRLTGEMAADVAKAKLPILPSSRPSLPRNPEIKQKVGRNDPCPCGSGKKFKTCCMRV